MTEFSELTGKHMLSGLETRTEKVSDWGYGYDSATVVYFVMDNKTYCVYEDPSDGYRSSMGSFNVVEDYQVKNIFPPQEVVGVMRPDDRWEKNDTIEFIDTTTGKLVLALGTDNFDDYYPMFVFQWKPENMAINKGVDSDRQVGQ